MSEKFKKPPIVEVMLGLKYVPSVEDNLDLKDAFHKAIEEEFPKVTEETIREFGYESKKYYFFNNEKTQYIQLSDDELIFSFIKLYPTWEHVKPILIKHLEIFNKTFLPKKLEHIGLFYLNEINIPNMDAVEIDEYFNYKLDIPDFIEDNNVSAMNFGFIYNLRDSKDAVMINLKSIKPTMKNHSTFFLEIGYALEKVGKFQTKFIDNWLENAHINILKFFLNSIKDKCKELFKEG